MAARILLLGSLWVVFLPMSAFNQDIEMPCRALRITGHSGQLTDVAFSPDASRIAAGSFDGTVRIWDATSGAELIAFHGHGGNQVVGVEFSPDGDRVVSRCNNGQVKVWYAQSGEELFSFVYQYSFGPVRFSRDGSWLVCGGDGLTLRDATTGQPRLRRIGFDAHPFVIPLNPDGFSVAVARGGSVTIYGLRSGRRWWWVYNDRPVIAMAFNGDGTRLALASWDAIRVWDIASWDQVLVLPDPSGTLESVAYSHDGELIVAATRADRVHAWDATSGELKWTIAGSGTSARCLVFSPDGKRLATVGDNNTLVLWNLPRKAKTSH